MQKELHKQKGFTLVELAIVLTIIGLLIGGILKGQQLMQNARITSTISQIHAIESATTTFRDTYQAMPGDMVGAQVRVPNCALCGVILPPVVVPPAGTRGDGKVGAANWTMATFQSASFAGGPAAGTTTNETVLFWYEMAQAGLLSGITDDGVNSRPATFGGSLPAARIGGGFLAGHANSSTAVMPGRPGGIAENMNGTVLTLVPTPAAPSDVAAVQPMSASVAAQIDLKMDDGRPSSGSVQPFGVTGSCYSSAAPFSVAARGYLGSNSAKNCGLYFQIQQ